MLQLRALRKEHGISMKELGHNIGVHESTISLYENGKREPDYTTLVRLSNFFDVTTDYLLGQTISPTEPPPSDSGTWIPVLGQVQAGIPTEAVQDIIGYEDISGLKLDAGVDYFALQIHGDSMEPRMLEGDVVIVRKQESVETGEIAVVLVNGDDATIKRIKKEPTGIMLIPSNPAYEPMFYSNHQIETLPIRILGKVIELRAKF